MKASACATLERGRNMREPYRSPFGAMFGAFFLRGPKGSGLTVISSGSDTEFGWEHVSVSRRLKTPSWEEMCFVKNLFWSEDEVVMQIHPAKADYVNHHPYCLHLWRPLQGWAQLPPSILVGPKPENP